MIYHFNWVLLPDLLIIPLYLYYCLKTADVLRDRHDRVWLDLGSFSLKNWGSANSWKTASYIVFQSEYKLLEDRGLDDLVFRTRFLFWLAAAIIVLNMYLISAGYPVVLTNAA